MALSAILNDEFLAFCCLILFKLFSNMLRLTVSAELSEYFLLLKLFHFDQSSDSSALIELAINISETIVKKFIFFYYLKIFLISICFLFSQIKIWFFLYCLFIFIPENFLRIIIKHVQIMTKVMRLNSLF